MNFCTEGIECAEGPVAEYCETMEAWNSVPHCALDYSMDLAYPYNNEDAMVEELLGKDASQMELSAQQSNAISLGEDPRLTDHSALNTAPPEIMQYLSEATCE